jgi:lambda family phage tail tape measure protein
MAEPTANLRVRLSADINDIKQGMATLRGQLNQVRTEAGRPLPAKNAIADLGVSAGQTQQALRQLPAQFTDIFTSLQGGMPFFTVLVQQGGQIKDSFGGVGPALKGVSSAVLGMVNPYTVAAAAVGTLTYAWYDAEKQQDAYTRALALSKNEAGATTLTLVDLAKKTSDAMRVTAGAGEEVAQAIGANGRVSAQNMQAVANAAIAMKDLTGQAIDETVSAYGKLADAPLQNAQKLNDQVNFMTLALYEQIRALQEQGRNQDAATVITRAASGETVMALAKVRASQDPVIGAFKDLFAWSTKAWGAMQATAGFGAEAAQMQQLLAANQQDVAWMNKGVADGMSDAWVYEYSQRIKARSKQIQEIGARAAQERAAAERKAAEAASAESMAVLDNVLDAQASDEEKKRREIARIGGQADAAIRRARAAGLIEDAEKIEARKALALAAIEKKYQEKPKGGSTAGATRSAGLQGYRDELLQEQATTTAATQQLRAQYAAREVSATEYYARMRDLTQASTAVEAKALESQIGYLRQQSVAGKDQITVGQQLGALEARLAKVRTEGAAKLAELATEERGAATQREAVLTAYGAALRASNEALGAQMQSAADRISMGEREYEIQQQLNDVYVDRANKLRELENQLAERPADKGIIDEKRALLEAATLDRLARIREGYADLASAEGEWLNGARAAWMNYQQQAANAAEQLGSVMSSVFSGMEDAWEKFTTGGKLSFSDLTRSVISDLARIAFRQSAIGMSNWLGGALSLTTKGITGFSTGGFTGKGAPNEVAGLVHKGEVVWSQRDVARAGGVDVVEGMRRGALAYVGSGLAARPPAAPPVSVVVPPLTRAAASELKVDIHNHGGGKVTARQVTQPQVDGSDLTRLIIDIVGESLDGGQLGAIGKSRYNWDDSI